ncbi:YceI family protein [uncultured Paracoccus sp.]|uniref:YceI family protein n=1 Tax=uncultured Paracoccus sp. TaxID=189685 RepID=UPI0026047D42|nr:YceI family protein [uncultured Paracoccus sp.]
MKHALSTLALLALTTLPGLAQEGAQEATPGGATLWQFDPGHSQIAFAYDHLGFSTTRGLFGGIEGQITLDEAAPENSAVEVSFPVRAMLTGWQDRFTDLMGPDFFDLPEGSDARITFASTSVESTGEKTATVTGDLTLNGVTKPVVLEVELNQQGENPVTGKPWIGFDAETTLKRSDFGLGQFAPAVGDEVEIEISVEAGKAE